MEDIKERFIDFLKTNGIYDLFVYELINASIEDGSFIHSISDYLDCVQPKDYINHAFVFDDSVYGYYFWTLHNGNWREIVDKENETDGNIRGGVSKIFIVDRGDIDCVDISETHHIKEIKIKFKYH